MEQQSKIQAQRQRANLFAFRRLKWGDPSQRFRVDHVLRKWRTPSKGRADPPASQRSEPEKQLLIVHLNQRRDRERLIDLAVWTIALIAVLLLAYAVFL